MAPHTIPHTIQQQRRTSSPKETPFKTPSQRWKLYPSRWTQQILWLEPWSLMNQTITHHILHHIHHYNSTTHLDHLHTHPHQLFHPGKGQWIPAQRSPHLNAGKGIRQSQPSSNPKTLTRDLHQNFQHYYKTLYPWHCTKRRDQPKIKPEKLSAQCVEPFCSAGLTHFKTLP